MRKRMTWMGCHEAARPVLAGGANDFTLKSEIVQIWSQPNFNFKSSTLLAEQTHPDSHPNVFWSLLPVILHQHLLRLFSL
ncbi:hypothetical protein K1719_020315 [Acacia pycnantha]|nr:hypothetical protein K1719_020315 [Acacia pycnantha]